MKYILKNPDVSNEQKPYLIRFPDDLKIPLSTLESFEPLTDKPIPISNYQKEMFTDKARTFWVVSYLPLSVIHWVIENLDGLTHYAYCTHDRDITPEGELKKVHTHLLLYFSDRVSAAYVCAYFHTCELKIISRYDIANEWNYLIHDSKKCRKEKKFLYSDSERFTDDKNYWLSRCVAKSENDYYVDMFNDYALNEMPVPMLIRKYGYEVIRSCKNLQFLTDKFRGQKVDNFAASSMEICDIDEVF